VNLLEQLKIRPQGYFQGDGHTYIYIHTQYFVNIQGIALTSFGQARVDGEERNYADSVTQFCKGFLFPRYKFLKKGWNEYDNSRNSLSSLVKRHVPTPEGTNYESIWERVAAPTIRLKYINIKCSLNKEIQDAFKSKSINMRYVSLCCILKQYELT
jgi:hypothetical protein